MRNQTITERMNLTTRASDAATHNFWEIDTAEGVERVNTLSTMCSELGIDLSEVDDIDFERCSDVLSEYYCQAALSGVSKIYGWFDK